MKDKILFVDDDPTLLKFLTEYFQDHPYEILTAHSGQEAIRLAYSARPALAVLDVMMPGMDGWEVCAGCGKCVISRSSCSPARQPRRINCAGSAWAWMITSPSHSPLLSWRPASRRCLPAPGSSRGKEENILRCGSLVVDLDKHEVTSDGTLLALTPTEFRLLEVLARRKGKAVSEEELIQEMWGANRQEESTAVRRYIWLLRKKIEPDPSLPPGWSPCGVTVTGWSRKTLHHKAPRGPILKFTLHREFPEALETTGTRCWRKASTTCHSCALNTWKPGGRRAVVENGLKPSWRSSPLRMKTVWLGSHPYSWLRGRGNGLCFYWEASRSRITWISSPGKRI